MTKRDLMAEYNKTLVRTGMNPIFGIGWRSTNETITRAIASLNLPNDDLDIMLGVVITKYPRVGAVLVNKYSSTDWKKDSDARYEVQHYYNICND